MARRILILNGPNLNMLGRREPEIYGLRTLADIELMCRDAASNRGLVIDFRQTNHEGELVDWIQKSLGHYCGLIINAAAYTHTSVAIHDALKLLDMPVVEVHLSDPTTREAFRHHSYIEPVAARVIRGKGADGYVEAVEYLASATA
ncbi:MAG: type II 3-dehydroquinate dehydratase [Alphaproteobacteria bacterium]|nr:type II 3-dehydroquinate dehydratase [Alphaproteobacteria bacterium]